MDTAAVAFHRVAKAFGGVVALRDLSLAVPLGRITVLLGPNGAGKTTAVRMITGAVEPDHGTVRTLGSDPSVDGESVRSRCGVVAAKAALYDRLSGMDNLAYAAALYGVERDTTARIRSAAARFDIHHALDQLVGGYSTGMRTRLALARALLHEPELLLLDEPTSGLDPESAHGVLQLIRDLTDGGTTVVMCTHLLIEAEGLADQIVVLDDGTNLVEGSQDALVRRYWPHTLVRFEAEEPAGLDILQRMPGVRRYERNGSALVELADDELVADCVQMLASRGVRLTRVEPHRPSLEQLYFRVRSEHRERLAGDGSAATSPGRIT